MKKRKVLLIIFIITSLLLGSPIVRYGLLSVEINTLMGYFKGDRGITLPLLLLPVAHLSLFTLFPLAKSRHFLKYLLIIPTLFIVVSVLAVFIYFLLDPIAFLTFVPFLTVWILLLSDAYKSYVTVND